MQVPVSGSFDSLAALAVALENAGQIEVLKNNS